MKRTFYRPLGLVCLTLGALGIFLPVLPTTPFVLLAAWFFAQSSEEWHRRLLESEVFGPMIKNWERNRCVSRRTKIIALVSMTIAGSASILFAIESPQLKLATAVLLLIGAATVLRLKTCPECVQERDEQA